MLSENQAPDLQFSSVNKNLPFEFRASKVNRSNIDEQDPNFKQPSASDSNLLKLAQVITYLKNGTTFFIIIFQSLVMN